MAVGSLFPNDWENACTAPETADATPIVNPALITRADQNIVWFDRRTRFFYVRLKYDRTLDGTLTPPIVQPWGVTTDTTDDWAKFHDQNQSQTITLTIDTASDRDDGTFKYTDHLTKQIIIDSISIGMLVGINTAFSRTGGVPTGVLTNSVVQVLAVY